MRLLSASRTRPSVDLRSIISSTAAVFAIWLLLGRFISEYSNYNFQSSLLKVFAKCPGLPYGAYSGGPDYIDISIHLGLTVVAAVFIYLTIRDIRRKRRTELDEGEDVENQDSEGDEL